MHSCVDPVEPAFEFKDGLIFVNAFALSKKGTSTVKIQKSVIENNRFRLKTIHNATVHFENINTNESILLTQDDEGIYIPPHDFSVATDESWKLKILLPDGRRIESADETVTSAVPIQNISATYDDEVIYDEGYERFLPGHKIFIEWTDPADEDNFYLWQTRSFETLHVCTTCERSHLRDGECTDFPAAPPYLDYLCDTMCWQIRHGEGLQIFEDRFANGTTISDKEIAILPYYRPEDILIEVQQLALSPSSYQYFKVINDVTLESGGLNAPPPSALLGNLFNPDDTNEPILGQFTATMVATKSLFIDRSNISATPVTPDHNIRVETCFMCPNFAPCEEGRFRTSIKPEGWQ